MGTVTILNDTNVPINTCISAGVNYSWCNQLLQKEYYVHEGGPGSVVTLNVKYYLGADTEYSQSGAEIGLFVAGIVLGVVGLIAIPLSGGTSISLIAASTALTSGAAGAAIGVAGLAVSGISVASKDFVNSPSTWTNIQTAQNRRFIAEGNVDASIDDDGLVTYKDPPQITLRELTNDEYQAFLRDKGDKRPFVSYRSRPISGAFLTKEELEKAGVLNKPVRMLPSIGGTACWEIENDDKAESTPIQLWVRDTGKVYWKIQSNENGLEGYAIFTIYNESLDRYVTVETKGNEHRVTSQAKKSGNTQKFLIIRSEGSYVFIPTGRSELAVISEGGNFGNSTKLRLDRWDGEHRAWARWRVTPVKL